MAFITYSPGNATVQSPELTFDITAITAERVGPFVMYYSFCTDGTMFVLRSGAGVDAAGNPRASILGWTHFDGSTALQEGSTDLPLQPFLDMMASRNPSSTRAFNWLMAGADHAWGSARADVIHTLGGDDAAFGQKGNDHIMTGQGNDLLDGGEGRDHLQGGAGDDTLTGGAGADVLAGGQGADLFLFHAAGEGGDRIADFGPGDRIGLDLAGLGLASAPSLGDGVLSYDRASGALSLDLDGAGPGVGEVLAVLAGHPDLGPGDILML